MDWEKLLTTDRYGHEGKNPEEVGRSHFHKDHDRIVFSSAFRKLAGKTQVHPLAFNDQIHSRLLHSLEVGSVGRSLGIKAGELLNQDLPHWIKPEDIGVIVQTACLAHDIGNPPFGHAGEFAIQDWFEQDKNQHFLAELTELEKLDLKRFEGNAQGFRVVSQVEYHFNDGGLRLTYPTLGSLLKYPWTADQSIQKENSLEKFSCYQSEKDILTQTAERLGLLNKKGRFVRHPLSYLMEAADDICYALIDLEDAVAIGILTFEEVKAILDEIHGQSSFDITNEGIGVSPNRKLAALRGKAIEAIMEAVLHVFKSQLGNIMNGELSGDLISHCPSAIQQGIYKAKQLAKNKVFTNIHKTQTEIGAYSVLSSLLRAFIGAGFELHQKKDNEKLSYKSKRILDLMQHDAPKANWSLYYIYMRIMDYIGGMTDQYAVYLARQISDPGEHARF